jgi:hypothetical protein
VGDAPELVSRPSLSPAGRRVLLVDETCDSGDTMRLAASVMKEEGAKEVRTAASFRTGNFRPDYWALQSPDFIILPWDRWIIQGGELVERPDYVDALRANARTGGHADTRTSASKAKSAPKPQSKKR